MTFSEKLGKALARRLTVMFIPHSEFQPVRLNFSVAFLVFLAVGWTGLTVWSGYIVSCHIDYWRTKTSESVLRAKMWYFTQEMNQSREYLDRVKETELALQNLLKMKTRKAIVQSSDRAMGGPTPLDRRALVAMLTGRRPSFQVEDMRTQLQQVKRSGSDVMSNFDEISRYITDQRELFRATPLSLPVAGRITSAFGQRRDPFEQGEGEFHHGLDIANSLGTPVRATADGVVRVASWQGGYGRLVVIDHGRGFKSYYGHNSKLLVKPGDRVNRNEVIALMGTSGHSTGYHVHYEVWQNGRPVNPLKFAKAREE
jgi:murein DD-endopeptidase MepM/ murein hydrolase activator NlpD